MKPAKTLRTLRDFPGAPVMIRPVLAGLLVGAVAVPGAAAAGPPPPAQAAGIGGFQIRAQSSVVTVRLYEETIPIPAEPQAELNLAYTRSTLGTGPDGRGTASWLWPGDAVGDGFGIIVGDPSQKWPSQVNARTPNGPEEEKQELTPGSGMRAAAGSGGVTAKVNLIGLAAPPSGSPALPGLPEASSPPPGSVPVPPGMEVLATAEGVTSSTRVAVKPDAVTATAHTAAKNVSLLGGLITIDTVDTRSTAASAATSAEADGVATVTGVTIAGQKLAVDSRGVRLADQGAELPEVPEQLADQLKALGIEVSPLATTRSVEGATGALTTQGMVITLDTKPLRSKLDTAPLDPVVGLLPQDLRDQLNLLLALGPKIVFVVGEVATRAAASPPAPPPDDVPAVPETPDAGAGAVAGDAPAAGDPPGSAAPGGGETPIRRAGVQLPPLGAIPKLLLLGALGLAAAIGWGLQRAGAVMLAGAASCEHGLVSGVPDLRKGQ